jgi:hypothetical protein
MAGKTHQRFYDWDIMARVSKQLLTYTVLRYEWDLNMDIGKVMAGKSEN